MNDCQAPLLLMYRYLTFHLKYSFQFVFVQARLAKVTSSFMLHTSPPHTTFYLTAEKIVRSLGIFTSWIWPSVCSVVRSSYWRRCILDCYWTISVLVCEEQVSSCNSTCLDL